MKKAWSRRTIDRLENGIIVLLVCSALFLVYQSGLVQNFAGQGAGTSGESVFTGVQNTALSRGTPVRLMVQLDDGRYGAQYDQTLVDQLYASGLSELLTDSIEAMESPRTVTQEVWQQAIAQSGPWVFYDFLYNVSFTAQSGQGEGAARFFLLTTRGGRADMVYYYTEETGDYYAGQIQDATLTLPASLDGLQPNGGQFVFEVPELAQVLAPYGILLDQPPTTTVYTAANPVASWGEAERTALLDALDFNTRALTIYESADGTVMQEGSDTLRIQEEGKIIYHASDSSRPGSRPSPSGRRICRSRRRRCWTWSPPASWGRGGCSASPSKPWRTRRWNSPSATCWTAPKSSWGRRAGGPSSSFPTAPSPPLPSACAPTPPPTGPSGPCRSGRRPPL